MRAAGIGRPHVFVLQVYAAKTFIILQDFFLNNAFYMDFIKIMQDDRCFLRFKKNKFHISHAAILKNSFLGCIVR